MKNLTFLIVFLFVLSFSVSSAYSQCIVTDPGDAGGGGGNDTLRECVIVVNTTAETVIQLNTNVTLAGANGLLLVTENLTLNGNMFTITMNSDAAGDDKIFTFNGAGNINVLNNVTLTGANANSNGGAIQNGNTNLTLNCVTVTGNTTVNDGGGIRSFGAMGSLTIDQSTISFNNSMGASNGGGGIFVSTHTLTITNSTITNNNAQGNTDGGGIFVNPDANLIITNSTINANRASGFGGGIFNGNTATLTHVTIAENVANFAADATDEIGGGIFFAGGSTTTTTNVLFFDNVALIFAGGVADSNCGSLVLFTHNDNGQSISDDTTCVPAIPLTAGVDPIGPLQNNGGKTATMAVLAGSNIFNTAVANCLNDDQRGAARVAGTGPCTVGAFQDSSGSITITKDIINQNIIGTLFTFTLTNIPLATDCSPNLDGSNQVVLGDSESVSCLNLPPDGATVFTITETTIPGFNLNPAIAANCTIGPNPLTSATVTDIADGITVVLNETGATVDCTFINDDQTGNILTVVKAGSGEGTVTAPAGNPPDGGINCGTDCMEAYDDGAVVTLNAVPANGSMLQGYSDECSDLGGGDGEAIMTASRRCVVTFIPNGANDVLNPGEPIEITQNGDTSVKQGGTATLELNFYNATGGTLNDVTLDVSEEQMVVTTKQDSTITRFEPTNIFLEPDIGTCVELVNGVQCTISQLVTDVDLFIDFEAVDVDQGDFDIPVQATSNDLIGIISSAIARMRVTGDGCSIAPAGSGGLGSLGILALIPAVMLFRRLRRKK